MQITFRPEKGRCSSSPAKAVRSSEVRLRKGRRPPKAGEVQISLAVRRAARPGHSSAQTHSVQSVALSLCPATTYWAFLFSDPVQSIHGGNWTIEPFSCRLPHMLSALEGS